MPITDVPFYGTLVLCTTLVAASYTFAASIAAGRGRPHLLGAARWGAYATCAFVLVATLVLAYAFQTHDFRIRYVSRYSDRSMAWWYLIASLWGGQDGSLLWWTLLLGGWTGACVRWMRGRFLELQPWVIATLMSVIAFFLVLMLWTANPFATNLTGAPPDGEGLNPLLQNYWMTIHPPTLYMGFVGWSVPFAFAIAALVTGRLEDEWLRAARKWFLVAWLFLSVGLVLGMVWSYEELGWGGYWAWDPVENASFMPWLVGTAFIHSVIVQERYGMMKMWNVFLICLTFFMTIFGTFLTRSGMISSVHAFARSEIGIYFVWFMGLIIAVCAALMFWRRAKLRSERRMESLLSREFAFLLNNWILLAMLLFVLILTTFPLLSDWMYGEEVSVGPPTYNRWMVPFGLILLMLSGVGPLISWRKATGKHLLRAFTKPTLFALAVAVLHGTLGGLVGFPGYIPPEEIYENTAAMAFGLFFSIGPLLSFAVCAFVVATVFQEFWRGTAVRMRSKGESPPMALFNLVGRAKRRYGGYIVHVGIVFMYLGFTGSAWDVERELTLDVGETLTLGREDGMSYGLQYEAPRFESDPNKQMLFADLTITDEDGHRTGEASPGKFMYRTHPEMPTTEVSIDRGYIEDVYVILSAVDQRSRRATLRAIVRPLVLWIWVGTLLLILGVFIALAPNVSEVLGQERSREGQS